MKHFPGPPPLSLMRDQLSRASLTRQALCLRLTPLARLPRPLAISSLLNLGPKSQGSPIGGQAVGYLLAGAFQRGSSSQGGRSG